MSGELLTAVGTIIGAVVSSAGLWKFLDTLALRRRRMTQAEQVDAAERVNDMTIQWAEQLKADAAEARADANEAHRAAAAARREADKLNAALRAANRQLDAIASKMSRLFDVIMEPDASVATIRTVAAELGRDWPGPNGRPGK